MPTIEQVHRLRELLPYQWECRDDQCDGQPHVRYPHPHARWKQQEPPGIWNVWALISGRGFGKTRTGAEFTKKRVLAWSGPVKQNRAAVIAPTKAIARDLCINGESGIIACLPPDRVKGFNPQTGILTLTNGGIIQVFGADDLADADAIRGYQFHTVWFEELATQRYQQVAWDNAAMALRLGTDPKTIVTATPRPTKLIKKLIGAAEGTVLTTGSTFDNAANLPGVFIKRMTDDYVGSRLEAQELRGELVEDVSGALWKRDDITVQDGVDLESMVRIVVAVDPAGTHKTAGALTGIVVVGMDEGQKCYVLDDRSGRYAPEEWGQLAVDLYNDFGAEQIVPERNFGADMVLSTIRSIDSTVNVKTDLVASRGKQARAEPIAGLYRRGLVVHDGHFPELEDQMCGWVPPGATELDKDGTPQPIPASDYSPDRIDALVWGVTVLRGLTGKRAARTRLRYRP